MIQWLGMAMVMTVFIRAWSELFTVVCIGVMGWSVRMPCSAHRGALGGQARRGPRATRGDDVAGGYASLLGVVSDLPRCARCWY